jgi:hypothetical protein
MYAVHAVLILSSKTPYHITLILLISVYTLDSFSTPAPTWRNFFRVRIESVIPTSRLPSSIRAHGAITIISTSTWEDISHWVISTFLETGGRRVGSGDILSSGTCGVRARIELIGREEVRSLHISLIGSGDVRLPDQENRTMVRWLLLMRMMVGKWRSRRMMSWRA